MASSRFDPRPPDRGESAGRAIAEKSIDLNTDEVTDETLLTLISQAEEASREDYQRRLARAVMRSQKAWRNEHADGSKYLDKINFKGRSRLFMPKVRVGIRKNKAATASALFSTTDVISIDSPHDDDAAQRASAAVIKGLIDYRLGGKGSSATKVPWYSIALGARQDADVTGCCISKQYWEWREEEDDDGEELLVQDPITGTYENKTIPKMIVLADRPMIETVPIDNVYMDPAAPWYDPVQGGAFWIVKWPMHLSEVKAMMKGQGKHGDGPAWLTVDDETLRKGVMDDMRSGARRSREKGVDRLESGHSMPRPYDIVWVNENFVRYNGKEMHFWSVGRHAMLSEPTPTRKVYPAFKGQRPYTMGYAEIEPHVTSPMPPVEGWMPLQLELNDVTNLRLDTLKRSIAPFAKVKRGRKVDFDAIKRRGTPEGFVILDDPEKDLIFEKTPGPGGAEYTETAHINAAFDELSGQFSTSSVQTNRQLNETVGGMNLMSAGSEAISEFDLRTWSETWCEPTLRQLVLLEQFYESDETILAIAGKKAQVFQRFGMSPTLDDLLAAEVTVTVNVGMGSQQPEKQLAKIRTGIEMLFNPTLLPFAEKQGFEPNFEEISAEVWGKCGYKDGDRFMKKGVQPTEPPPDPKMLQVQQQGELGNKKLQLDAAGLQMEDQHAQMEDQRKRDEHKLNAKVDFMKHMSGQQMEHQAREREGNMEHEARTREGDRGHEASMAQIKAKSEQQANKGNGQGGQSRAVATQSPEMSVMQSLVQRLDQMESRDQQGGSEEKIMMAIAAMLGRLDAAVEKMGAPKRVIRDPRTNEIIGTAPVEQGNLRMGG